MTTHIEYDYAQFECICNRLTNPENLVNFLLTRNEIAW